MACENSYCLTHCNVYLPTPFLFTPPFLPSLLLSLFYDFCEDTPLCNAHITCPPILPWVWSTVLVQKDCLVLKLMQEVCPRTLSLPIYVPHLVLNRYKMGYPSSPPLYPRSPVLTSFPSIFLPLLFFFKYRRDLYLITHTSLLDKHYWRRSGKPHSPLLFSPSSFTLPLNLFFSFFPFSLSLSFSYIGLCVYLM